MIPRPHPGTHPAWIVPVLVPAVALCLAAAVHAEPGADAIEQQAAGTYRVDFDSGPTRIWRIQPGCSLNVTPCLTLTQDGPTDWPTGPVQHVEMRYQEGQWWVVQIPRASAPPTGDQWVTTATEYLWNPSTLAGRVDDTLMGPGNYRARAYRTDRVDGFTLTRIG